MSNNVSKGTLLATLETEKKLMLSSTNIAKIFMHAMNCKEIERQVKAL